MVTALTIIETARGEIGTKATDVKRCKYNNWYYGGVVSGNEYDWCETFVQWVFAKCSAQSLLYGKTANCGWQARQFKDKGKLVYNKDYSILSSSQIKPGDVVFFHWSNEKSTYCPGVYTCDHVGIVEQVNLDGTVNTIEGNTGSSSNGEVMRRTRSGSVISCVGRPAYVPSPTPTPTPIKTVPDVLYRARFGGKWGREVNNLSSYAGQIGEPITDVAIKAVKGRVKYRVHILGGDWLPYVTGYDISDNENGYAGDLKPTDAVEVYYYTPADLADQLGYYLRAEYRVSPVNESYFDWQFDNETSNRQDGYAGDFGTEIDRFQMILSK